MSSNPVSNRKVSKRDEYSFAPGFTKNEVRAAVVTAVAVIAITALVGSKGGAFAALITFLSTASFALILAGIITKIKNERSSFRQQPEERELQDMSAIGQGPRALHAPGSIGLLVDVEASSASINQSAESLSPYEELIKDLGEPMQDADTTTEYPRGLYESREPSSGEKIVNGAKQVAATAQRSAATAGRRIGDGFQAVGEKISQLRAERAEECAVSHELNTPSESLVSERAEVVSDPPFDKEKWLQEAYQAMKDAGCLGPRYSLKETRKFGQVRKEKSAAKKISLLTRVKTRASNVLQRLQRNKAPAAAPIDYSKFSPEEMQYLDTENYEDWGRTREKSSRKRVMTLDDSAALVLARLEKSQLNIQKRAKQEQAEFLAEVAALGC